MSKRGERSKPEKDRTKVRGIALAEDQGHPPQKRPVMLAISAVLFAAWFVFLLATALGMVFAPAAQMR
jgi:hypothetical protein